MPMSLRHRLLVSVVFLARGRIPLLLLLSSLAASCAVPVRVSLVVLLPVVRFGSVVALLAGLLVLRRAA